MSSLVARLKGSAKSILLRRGSEEDEAGHPFLRGEEHDRFEDEYPRFPRWVLETERVRRRRAQTKVRNARKGPQPRLLTEVVADALRPSAASKTTAGVRSMIVCVEEDDGMSWAASAADAAVAEAQIEFERLHLQGLGSRGRLPAIAALLGPRRVAEIARKHGITESFRALAPGIRGGVWGLVGLMVLLTFVESLADAWSASGVSISVVTSVPFLATVVAGTIAGFTYEYLTARSTDLDTDAMATLAAQFESAAQDDPAAHDACVIALARELAGEHDPRCVIVDDFGRLDVTTAAVLRRYLAKHATRSDGFEVWIVFESRSDRQLWNTVTSHSLKGAFTSTQLFEMRYLDENQRDELARYVGAPERADFASVRAIREAASSEADEVDRFFDEYRKRVPAGERAGSLELIYLLSLTASWGRSPLLTDEYVISNLSSTRVHNEPLGKFLHGRDLTRSELRRLLEAINHDFRRYVAFDAPQSAPRGRPLVFGRADIGDKLAKSAEALALPNPALGHIFWSILWFDKLQKKPPQAFWARRLARHVRSGAPEAHACGLSGDTVRKLFAAAMFSARACLHTCVLDPVPDVLDAALDLLDSDDTGLDERDASELLRVAWEAYAVLGDERLLATILATENLRGGVVEEATPPENPLERVFVESLDVPAAVGMGTWRSVASGRTRDWQALVTYARTRGAWLARTFEPFTEREQMLVAAADASYEELDTLVGEALGRLREADGDGMLAVDFMSASLGLWTIGVGHARGSRLPKAHREALDAIPGYAGPSRLDEMDAESRKLFDAVMRSLAGVELTHAKRLVELMQEATTTARRARERSMVGGTSGVDFVTEALANELMIMVGACADLAVYQPDTSFSSADEERMLELRAEALKLFETPTGRDAGAPSATLEHHLRLLEIAWSGLGLPQLSNYTGLRAAHYEALIADDEGVDRPDAYEDAYEKLAGDLESPGHVGVMAGAVLAEAAGGTADLVGRLLRTSAELALEAPLGPQLCAELSIIGLRTTHSLKLDVDTLLEYLVGSVDGEVPHLTRWLDALTDEEMEIATLQILNCVRYSTHPDLAARVIDVLERRVEEIDDPVAAEHARQEIDLSRLIGQVNTDKGAIDVEETILSWRDRMRTTCYAMVLYLLRSPSPPQLLLDEAVAVIRTTEGSGKASAVVHLAHWLARYGAQANGSGGAERQAGVQFLVRAIPDWDARLSLEATIDIYRLLRTEDAVRAPEHARSLVRWETMRHHRDSLELLPARLEQGQYFLLFVHYYDTLMWWGLPADRPPAEIDEWLHASTEMARKTVTEWQEDGAAMPRAFVSKRGKLSSDFLILGHLLFKTPPDGNGLDAVRREFDREAREAMTKLYSTIQSAREIPEPIREILERHRSRFESFTVPD